jgi:hypothetical protein
MDYWCTWGRLVTFEKFKFSRSNTYKASGVNRGKESKREKIFFSVLPSKDILRLVAIYYAWPLFCVEKDLIFVIK